MKNTVFADKKPMFVEKKKGNPRNPMYSHYRESVEKMQVTGNQMKMVWSTDELLFL